MVRSAVWDAKSGSRRLSAAIALACAAVLLTGCIAPALPPSVLDAGEDGLPDEGWHPKLSDVQRDDCRSCHKEGAEETSQ